MAGNIRKHCYLTKRTKGSVFIQCYCWASTLLQSSSDVLHLHVAVQRKWDFYPRDAMLARVLAVVVCLSVCLSHAGIVSKLLNVRSRKQCHVIAQGL